MEDTKRYVEDICDLKKSLVAGARDAVSQGLQCVNTKEMGEVADMIKDLAEAEKECWEAMYYKSIVEAMHEESEAVKRGDYQGDRMGYDNWRYSSGRFAPTGHGHRSGYTPIGDGQMMPMMDQWDDRMMGYNGGSRGGSSSRQGSAMGSDAHMEPAGYERGHRYGKYHQARMGYHESKSSTDKQHMDAAARDYVLDTAESMREIWKDSDPALRKEIKNKLATLVNEMN